MVLSDDEIDRITNRMIEKVQEQKHNFWIDPETHYQDHIAMREMASTWGSAKSIFTKAFIGLVVIGSFVLAGVGLLKDHLR